MRSDEFCGGVAIELGGSTCGLLIVAPRSVFSTVHVADCIALGNTNNGLAPPYEPEAWGPDANWRSWSPEPLTSSDAQVQVFNAACPEIKALAQALDGAETQDDVEERMAGGAFAFSQTFTDRVQAASASPDRTRLLGVSAGPSGLRTATVNQRVGQRIGLHVDDWDRAVDLERGKARLRICVNLGRETRYFLAVPVALHKAMSHWHETLAIGDLRGTDAARALLAKLRPKVLRIPIPPLHAYMAPTETLVHDATTEPMEVPDHALTILGYFDPQLLKERIDSVP